MPVEARPIKPLRSFWLRGSGTIKIRAIERGGEALTGFRFLENVHLGLLTPSTRSAFVLILLLDEGRLRRRSQRRSGMRRPRVRLVTSHPGGLGVPVRSHYEEPPSVAGRGGDEGGRKPAGRRRALRPLSPPGRTGPGTQIAAVERREAPSSDRKEEGDASQASRAAAPAAQGASQAPAFPGAPLPSCSAGA